MAVRNPNGTPGKEGKESAPIVFNVQKYITEAGGKVMEGFQNAIKGAEEVGGGIVQLTGNVSIPTSTTRGTSLTIKASNVIIDGGGYEVTNAPASTANFESIQEKMFLIQGTAGASFTVSKDIQEGAFTIEATNIKQSEIAENTSLLVTSTRKWDPEGVNSTLGEIVVTGVPDGYLGGEGGSTTNGITVGKTITEIKTSYVGPVEWPTTGELQVDSEKFVYTAVVLSPFTGLATFTVEAKVATETHKRGSRAFLVPPEGIVYLRTPVTQEGALANTAGLYTEGVSFATADTAKVQILSMVENVTIRNLRIQGAGPGQNQAGIAATITHKLSLENVRSEGFDFQSFAATRSTFGKVVGCRTEHSKDTNLVSGLVGYGVALTNVCQDWIVDGLRHSAGRHGVTLGGVEGQDRRITVRNSFIEGTGTYGIDSHGSGIDYVISGNTFVGCTGGIDVNCPRAIITNNRFIRGGASAVAILLAGQSKGSWDYTVTGNEIISFPSVAILMQCNAGLGPTVKTEAGKTNATLSASEAEMLTLEVGMPIVSAPAEIATGTIITAINTVTKVITLSVAAGKTEAAASCLILRGAYNFRSVQISGNHIYNPTAAAIEVKTHGEGNTLVAILPNVSISDNTIVQGKGTSGISLSGASNASIVANSINALKATASAILLKDVTNSVVSANALALKELSTGVGISATVGTGGAAGGTNGNIFVGNAINSAKEGIKQDGNCTKSTVGMNVFTNTTTPVTLGAGAENFNQMAEQANIATPAETTKANTEAITKISETLKKARITL